MGRPSRGATREIQKKQKWFQTNDSIFFAKFDHVATILLEDRKRVTADWYVEHCLLKVFQSWCKRRPRTGVRGLLLPNDNVSVHTAAVTLGYLVANDVQLVTHPPYSSDLAPCDWFLFPSCDWFLFPSVKRQLKGNQFQSTKDAEHSSRASFWIYHSSRSWVS